MGRRDKSTSGSMDHLNNRRGTAAATCSDTNGGGRHTPFHSDEVAFAAAVDAGNRYESSSVDKQGLRRSSHSSTTPVGSASLNTPVAGEKPSFLKIVSLPALYMYVVVLYMWGRQALLHCALTITHICVANHIRWCKRHHAVPDIRSPPRRWAVVMAISLHLTYLGFSLFGATAAYHTPFLLVYSWVLLDQVLRSSKHSRRSSAHNFAARRSLSFKAEVPVFTSQSDPPRTLSLRQSHSAPAPSPIQTKRSHSGLSTRAHSFESSSARRSSKSWLRPGTRRDLLCYIVSLHVAVVLMLTLNNSIVALHWLSVSTFVQTCLSIRKDKTTLASGTTSPNGSDASGRPRSESSTSTTTASTSLCSTPSQSPRSSVSSLPPWTFPPHLTKTRNELFVPESLSKYFRVMSIGSLVVDVYVSAWYYHGVMVATQAMFAIAYLLAWLKVRKYLPLVALANVAWLCFIVDWIHCFSLTALVIISHTLKSTRRVVGITVVVAVEVLNIFGRWALLHVVLLVLDAVALRQALRATTEATKKEASVATCIVSSGHAALSGRWLWPSVSPISTVIGYVAMLAVVNEVIWVLKKICIHRTVLGTVFAATVVTWVYVHLKSALGWVVALLQILLVVWAKSSLGDKMGSTTATTWLANDSVRYIVLMDVLLVGAALNRISQTLHGAVIVNFAWDVCLRGRLWKAEPTLSALIAGVDVVCVGYFYYGLGASIQLFYFNMYLAIALRWINRDLFVPLIITNIIGAVCWYFEVNFAVISLLFVAVAFLKS